MTSIEKKTKLRDRYIDSFPRKVESLEQAIEGVLARRDVEDEKRLRMLAHQLAGSGGSYGFQAISDRARALECAPLEQLGPAFDALKTQLGETYERELAQRSRLILIVEDDPDMQLFVRAVSEGAGADVIAVATARAALLALETNSPALIVLDLVLPDADGREVLRTLRERPTTAHTPVLVVSANNAISVRRDCIEAGVDHFLEKPIDESLLGAAIRAALTRGQVFRAEARQDPLTGLGNRAWFREQVTNLQSIAKRAQMPLTIAIIDLDRFKAVNDTFGHAVGDEVLTRFSTTLKRRLRSSDACARWGGEEFVVAFANTHEDGAALALRKVMRAFETEVFGSGDKTLTGITFSAGVAGLSSEAFLDHALDEADRFLYRAKARGRSLVIGASDASDDAHLTRVLIAEDDADTAHLIRSVLEADGLATDVAVNGAEALRFASANSYQAFVLDWLMPVMGGAEALEKLRADEGYGQTPILVLTALGDEGTIAQAFDAGADDYVQKPFRSRELIARLRRLLARA